MELIDDLTFLRPEQPQWWFIFWSIVFGVIALAILIKIVFILWRKYQAYREYTRPRREAIIELDTVFGVWKERGYQKFMFRVVFALKRFLTENFKSNASALTYDELDECISEIQQLNTEEQKEVMSILDECDQYCYALAAVTEADIEKVYEKSRSFVMETWENK